MSEPSATSLWFHAAAQARDYLTPEDIHEALAAGATAAEVAYELLDALGSKQGVEDTSLCAFLVAEAMRGEK